MLKPLKLRKRLFLMIAALAVVVPVCCAVALEAGSVFERHIRDDLEKTVVIVNKKGEKFAFDVELAINRDQQQKGLMYVTDMPLGSGMLFLFRTSELRTFWMKNTFIPLDMIFIEGDGKIQHIHSMAKPQDLAKITSPRPAKAVLEINGGVADKLGIEPGDVVYHSFFNNAHMSP